MSQANSSQAVYEHIREGIITGEFQPGMRLVNRTLGKELGVSPVPVREALHRLVSDGVVEQIPGAGTYVRKLTKQDFIDLYAIRELLEGFAAALAAVHARPDQIAELKAIAQAGMEIAREIRDEDGQVASAAQRKAWLDLELSFHQSMFSVGGNPWLSRTIEQLQLLSAIIYSKPRSVHLSEVCRTCLEHARLARMIGQGDIEKAQDLMTKHLQAGMQSQLMAMGKETK